MKDKITTVDDFKEKTQEEGNKEYKQTPIGEIPVDWDVVKLGEVCERIKSGGTPLTSIKDHYGGDIKFVKIKDLTTSKKYLSETSTKITEKGLNSSNAWTVPEKSVLLGIYGSLGSTAINRVHVATNQAILGIVPDKGKLNEEFLYYFFTSSKNMFLKQAKHTTQANLTLEIIENLKIPLPPLLEQQKIAEILSTTDQAIQKSDETIAKTERLKKGMMQELLTKGIGHEEFKGTEIGEIPAGWEVVKVNDVFEFTKKPRNLALEDELIPFIAMDNIPDNGIYPKKFDLMKMEDIKSGTFFFEGDLLVAKITPSFENGKQCIANNLPTTFGYATTEVWPIHETSNTNIMYLFYFLKKSNVRSSLAVKMEGTTGRQRVPRNVLENLKIPLPPLPEQQKIAEILSNIDKKLEFENKRKQKLERVKKGLMNDLLTGKKRVQISG
ncbi:MAG: restriction endonuclease subunit S [Methanobacteriaceae archaeon]|jgi:type I restriction enzyme S subunit